MTQIERGKERRRSDAEAELPRRVPDGDLDAENRRVGPDRRANAFISEQEICRELPYSRVEPILAKCPIRELAEGDVLLEPGQTNHFLFLLLSGQLQVNLGPNDAVPGFPIEAGECIGEMSIIDGEPTSAYVVALEPSRVMAVPDDVFWSEIAPLPGAARNLMRVLAERMRYRNDVTLQALEHELRFKHLQTELSAAQEIQISVLPGPERVFPSHPQVDMRASMTPASKVGGDFFDGFALDANRICVSIGDVSGKGMPASLFMMRVLALLRAELNKGDNLGSAVDRLNATLCKNNTSYTFVSLFVMIMDVANGDVEFVNAGHNPPLIASPGQAFEFLDLPKGTIAGVLEEAEFPVNKLAMQAGDVIVLYTDGVTEARNRANEFYTAPRLKDFLSSREFDDAHAVLDATLADLHGFATERAQADDITLLVLKYRGPAGRSDSILQEVV